MTMRRFVAVSDLHLDAATAGVTRHDDIAEALKSAVRAAVDIKADGFLFGGDAMDPDSGSCVFECVRTLLWAARTLSEADIPSLWIAGNHDVIESSKSTTLAPLRESSRGAGVFVDEVPGLHMLSGIPFFTLPYPALSNAYDPKAAAKRLAGDYRMVLGHLMLDGIHPGEETTEMARGRDVMWPLEETKGAELRLGGHFHRRQLYTSAGGHQVQIIGSLARLKLGHDEDLEPGFLIVDVAY